MGPVDIELYELEQKLSEIENSFVKSFASDWYKKSDDTHIPYM